MLTIVPAKIPCSDLCRSFSNTGTVTKPGGIGQGLCRLRSRFASILPKGSERVLTSIRPVTYVTANPVEYVTIRMDGEEMTN